LKDVVRNAVKPMSGMKWFSLTVFVVDWLVRLTYLLIKINKQETVFTNMDANAETKITL